jgi:hypothetical protein
MTTIKFESVEILPSNTLAVGEQYIIRVKCHYIPAIFRFPLAIPNLLGIIFKKGDDDE